MSYETQKNKLRVLTQQTGINENYLTQKNPQVLRSVSRDDGFKKLSILDDSGWNILTVTVASNDTVIAGI